MVDVNTPQDNILYLSTALVIMDGEGSPEGVVNAALGSLYCDKLTGDYYKKGSALGTLTGWASFGGGGGGGSIGGSIAANQVAVGSGANTIAGYASLIYDEPNALFYLTQSINAAASLASINTSAGTSAIAQVTANANSVQSTLFSTSSGYTPVGLFGANYSVLNLASTTAALIRTGSGAPLIFGIGSTEYARLTSTVLTLFGSASGSVTGLSVTSGSAGNAVTIASLSSGTSEEIFIIPKGNAALKVGTGGGAGSTDQGLYLSRLLNNSNGSGNGHAFVDASTFARTTGGPNGYASFDTPVIVGSAAAYDHYVSYQARPTTAASSTWSDIFGAYFTATFGASSTATRNTGVWINPPVMGAGATITNNVGIWVDGTTAVGSFNYSLVSTGVSYFLTHAGAVALGTTTNPSTALHIRGNATRESLLRFTPNANASFVGCEWTDNSNLGVTTSLKYKANTGEFQLLASTSAFLTFLTNAAEVLRLDVSGNLLLGATAAGISASKVFAHKLGVAPTAQPADLVQEYVLDAVAGKSEKYITDEAGYTARLTGCLKILNQDFSTTTTTLANVVGSVAKYDLAHDVEAGRRYRFKIWFTTDNEFGSGVKVNIAGSATMTHSRASYKITQLAATGLGIVDQYAEESTFSTTVSKATTTGLNFIVEIEGSFIVNAAGTVLLQFAEETATGTGKIRQGAYFELSMSE